MAEMVDPVVRRRPGDPLVYLCARHSDGWSGHAMAFPSTALLWKSGWVVGAWQTDVYGDYANVTRP